MDSFNKGLEVSMQILNWIFQAMMAVFGFFAPIILVAIVISILALGVAFVWVFFERRKVK